MPSTGDFEEMLKQRYIRALVSYSKTQYYVINGVQHGSAAYNAGPGRIRSLRAEVAKNGLDPNVWMNNVEMIAAARIGMETVTCVANIYKYYIAYRLVAEAQPTRQKELQQLKSPPVH